MIAILPGHQQSRSRSSVWLITLVLSKILEAGSLVDLL